MTVGGDPVAHEPTDGAALIAAERARQVAAEGWTLEHDALFHTQGELAWAATCYAAPKTVYRQQYVGTDFVFSEPWPASYDAGMHRGEGGWGPWRRPDCDRITELVRAGALIAAEIDRLQRIRAGDGGGS